MPRGESFWNPYRWVPVAGPVSDRRPPAYHHRLVGLAGRVDCTLEALTPLLINDGHGQFVRNAAMRPYLPATSLKGMVRSLAELVGNAAAPFPRSHVDDEHQLAAAAEGPRLDVTARTFGHLHGRRVHAGLVRFGDGELLGDKVPPALSFKVAGGNPKPEHTPFYPTRRARKLYHHNPGADKLTPHHPGIKADQIRTVRPLPPGVRFRFTVSFFNLGDDELALLLYCLALEEEVTVTLSREALGRDHGDSVTLKGPLRHKFGYGKPQGGGSVHLRVEKLELRSDAAARYRGAGQASRVLEGEELRAEVARRTQPIAARRDATMQHLRAMLVYAADDPRRGALDYPTYAWFQEDKQHRLHRPLKPTL